MKMKRGKMRYFDSMALESADLFQVAKQITYKAFHEGRERAVSFIKPCDTQWTDEPTPLVEKELTSNRCWLDKITSREWVIFGREWAQSEQKKKEKKKRKKMWKRNRKENELEE